MAKKEDFLNERGIVECIETDTHIYGLFSKYRPLSNFHLESIIVDGFVYQCAEAAYMAEKTQDLGIKRLLSEMTGLEAKTFSKTMNIVSNWNDIRVSKMARVLTIKFYSCQYLADLLISTGDKYIEETNWWKDDFWGVYSSKGRNIMGQLLREIRDKLNNIVRVAQW